MQMVIKSLSQLSASIMESPKKCFYTVLLVLCFIQKIYSFSVVSSPFNYETSSRVVDDIVSLLDKVKQAGTVPLMMVNSKAVDIGYVILRCSTTCA